MRKEPSLRLPILDDPSDFEQLSFLSEAEKKQGIELLKSDYLGTYAAWGELPAHDLVKKRERLLIQSYDPRLAELGYKLYYEVVEEITGINDDEFFEWATSAKEVSADDPERLRRRHLANLFVLKVAYEYKAEWALRIVMTMPTVPVSAEQSTLLGFPQSDVWNDDERLVLQFTHAMIHNDMSDELFDRANAAWGPKGIVRRATWVGLYLYYLMLGQLNLTDAFKRGETR